LAQSSSLSATSVQSIIDGLATLETPNSQTLTLNKVFETDKDRLTDEQIATITTEKKWSLSFA
jgi:hypothetical protein